MSWSTMAANKWHTFGNFLKGNSTAMEAAAAESGKLARGKMLGRGIGKDQIGTAFSMAGRDSYNAAFTASRDAGGGFLKSHWAGAQTLGGDSFQKGYGTRLGVGAGLGAVAGGAKSYYDGDGAGGYAGNILGGAALGAAGGHGYAGFRTKGTLQNAIPGALKAAWKA